MEVIAVHEIRRMVSPGIKRTKDNPGKPPKEQVIKPGTLFVSEGEELKKLQDAGAVRAPDKQARIAANLQQAMDEDEPVEEPKKTRGRKKAATKAAEPTGEGDGSDMV